MVADQDRVDWSREILNLFLKKNCSNIRGLLLIAKVLLSSSRNVGAINTRLLAERKKKCPIRRIINFRCDEKQIHIRSPSCYNHYGFVPELYCSNIKFPARQVSYVIVMAAGINAKRHQRRREGIAVFVSCAVFSAKNDNCTISMFSSVW